MSSTRHAGGTSPPEADGATKPATLLLLGVELEADNLGLEALAAGAVAAWREFRSDGALTVLDYAHAPKTVCVSHRDNRIPVPTVPMRFSWRLHLSNNIVRLLWTTLWTRPLPRKMRDVLRRRNRCLRTILEADLVAALSGGDSFSDIYGLGRFFYVLLPQVLVLWTGRPLRLLPQTCGPFRTRVARRLAAYVLRRAERVHTRDPNGVAAVKALAGDRTNRVRFAHDLGFALAPQTPSADRLLWIETLKRSGPLVGLNVSGLLYAGGYTRGNMFGLAVDYRELMRELLRRLLERGGHAVVLVPHVWGQGLEGDPPACADAREQLPPDSRSRVHLVAGRWTAGEIKHLIGQCEFFIGSRMHACIAALSQAVPAAGLAYSPKFAGVFESVGLGNLVFNLDTVSREQVLEGAMGALGTRDVHALRLRARLPEVQAGRRAVFAP